MNFLSSLSNGLQSLPAAIGSAFVGVGGLAAVGYGVGELLFTVDRLYMTCCYYQDLDPQHCHKVFPAEPTRLYYCLSSKHHIKVAIASLAVGAIVTSVCFSHAIKTFYSHFRPRMPDGSPDNRAIGFFEVLSDI